MGCSPRPCLKMNKFEACQKLCLQTDLEVFFVSKFIFSKINLKIFELILIVPAPFHHLYIFLYYVKKMVCNAELLKRTMKRLTFYNKYMYQAQWMLLVFLKYLHFTMMQWRQASHKNSCRWPLKGVFIITSWYSGLFINTKSCIITRLIGS